MATRRQALERTWTTTSTSPCVSLAMLPPRLVSALPRSCIHALQSAVCFNDARGPETAAQAREEETRGAAKERRLQRLLCAHVACARAIDVGRHP